MTSSSWGDEPPGATPLQEEDFEQLIPTHIATRADLNAAERDNILYLHLIGENALPWRPDESDLFESRDAYISALRAADQGDCSRLVAYAIG